MAIIGVMELRTMRWVGYVARMVREEVFGEFWREIVRDRDHLEDLLVNGRIILKRILKKSVRML